MFKAQRARTHLDFSGQLNSVLNFHQSAFQYHLVQNLISYLQVTRGTSSCLEDRQRDYDCKYRRLQLSGNRFHLQN